MIETRFKDTEIGRIPEDWEAKALGDVLSVGNGKDYKHLPFGNIPVYGTGGYMTSVSDYLHDGETVCIGRKGTIDEPQYHTGKIWTVDTLFYTYGFQNVCVKYLFYLFNRIDWKKYNEATGVPSLTSKNILAIIAQFPILSEQTRIATALSKVDSLISELGRLIDKKRAIKQGAMQQLLTGKKRLKGFSEPWVEKKLGEILSLKNGFAFKSETYCAIGKYKIITIANVQNGRFDLTDYNSVTDIPASIQQHQKLSIGDILISMTGNVGRVCRVDSSNCLLNQRVGLLEIRPNVNSDFVFTALNTNAFENAMRDKGQGAAQANISKSDIEDYVLLMPSSLLEQQAIASVLTSMDNELSALEAKRKKYEQIKQGMMQQLLTGRINLN